MKEAEVPWFRDLYQEINSYCGNALFHEVLCRWIDKGQTATAAFRHFASPTPYDPTDEAAQFSMWNLYALSRVNDLLLASFQQAVDGTIPTVTLCEYETFFTRLGFQVGVSDNFAAIHDEIVEVRQVDEPGQPLEIVGHRWPSVMWGDMVFSRSGAEVIGGLNHVIKGVAETSTLYFTFRRQNRGTDDLSMGWGHNSQWRTNFRRDYLLPGKRIYNLDGRELLTNRFDADEDRDGLTHAERVELCKHRCFIVSTKPDEDLWPYDDRLEEVT